MSMNFDDNAIVKSNIQKGIIMDNSVLDIFHPVIKEWFEGIPGHQVPQEPIDAAANFYAV